MNPAKMNSSSSKSLKNKIGNLTNRDRILHKLSSILAALLCLISVPGCSPKQSGYNINIRVDGLSDGMVTIGTYDKPDYEDFNYDSAQVKNGQARITGTIGIPQLMDVIFMPQRMSFKLFVDNSDITVVSDTSRYDKKAHKLLVDITGGNTHSHWKELTRQFFSDYYNLKDSLKGNNSKEAEIALQKQWQSDLPTAPKRIFTYLSEHPDDVAALRILFDYNQGFSYYFAELGNLVHSAGLDVKGSRIFPYFENEFKKLSAIQPGQPSPAFTLRDTSGILVSLADQRGKIVLLDFWAYWCGPCRAFFPELKSLYQDYHSRGFEIIGINTDSNIAKWHQAIKEENTPWIQVNDTVLKGTHSRIASSTYCITAIPTSYLINQDGIIVNRDVRGVELRKQVDSLLQKMGITR